MKQSNNAIHRAAARQLIPPLPEGFNQRVMARIRRREQIRAWIQYIASGVAIVAIFAIGLSRLFEHFDFQFGTYFTLPDITILSANLALIKKIAIFSIPLILMLLIDSYLRFKMEMRFLFKEEK